MCEFERLLEQLPGRGGFAWPKLVASVLGTRADDGVLSFLDELFAELPR